MGVVNGGVGNSSQGYGDEGFEGGDSGGGIVGEGKISRADGGKGSKECMREERAAGSSHPPLPAVALSHNDASRLFWCSSPSVRTAAMRSILMVWGAQGREVVAVFIHQQWRCRLGGSVNNDGSGP